MLMLLVIDVKFNFKKVFDVLTVWNHGIISLCLDGWLHFLTEYVKLGIIFWRLSVSNIDGWHFWLFNLACSDIFILFINDDIIIFFFNPWKEKVKNNWLNSNGHNLEVKPKSNQNTILVRFMSLSNNIVKPESNYKSIQNDFRHELTEQFCSSFLSREVMILVKVSKFKNNSYKSLNI